MLEPATHRRGWATPLLAFLVLGAGIGVAAWVHLSGVQRDIRERAERELSSIADVKVGELVAWREAQQREWSAFCSNAFVNRALRRMAERAADEVHRRALAGALDSTRARLDADAALVLDARGEVVLAVPADARPTLRQLETARRAANEPEPLLDEGAPGDDLAVAVAIDPATPDSGVLLARYVTVRAVSPVALRWPHMASTAEPVVVRRDGDWIVPVTAHRHGSAPRLPIALDIPAARALKGQTGIVECGDYRGVPVIAALRQVPGSSWSLSVKVDRAEVFGPARRDAAAFGSVTLLLLMMAGGAVWFWWRVQVAAFERRAHDAEEQALRCRFDALWSQAHDVVLVCEPGGRLLDANRRALETYGYDRDELRELRVEDLRAADARGVVAAQLARIVDEGSSRFETTHRRKDGTVFPVEVSASRLEIPTGRVLLAVIRDTTERQAAAAAARYQATLLENLNDAVIGLDLHANITAWEGAAERIYGYVAEEAIGKRIAALLGGDLPDETDARIQAEIARTGRCRTEVRHARKDGQPVDIEVTSVAIRDATGVPSGFVVVHRDIGDRKRAEAEQRRLHAELVFADRLASIGTLAAGVAHEINNPLAFLVANLEYLKQEADAGGHDVDRKDALREASEGARRISEIVRGLKAFGRRDGATARGAVDVRKAVSAATNMVQAQARPRAQLVLELAETPPVLGKEHEVAQVVLNLAMNAIQAIPEGRPAENEVRISTRTGRDGFVELAVRDTGVGIAPEVLGRIYDPFFTTKEAGEGSGLGLSICLGLVRGMGGSIHVDTAVGRGTTFTVRLPAAPVAQASRALPPPRPRRRGRILVLDDESMVCAAVRRSLEADHEVVTISDPRAALERLAGGESYDVVVCDLLMPHMTGMQCYDALARHRPEVARRMVFLTGGAFTPGARKFMEDHRARCIDKPFDPEELRARIADAVERLAEA